MEYLFLSGACLFFSIQFIFNKYFERGSNGTFHAGVWCALVQSISMLAYLMPANGFRFSVSVSAIICSLLYAASTMLCTGVTLLALRRGKLSVVTTYTLLGGLVLPFLWGIAAYGEPFTWQKGVGMVLLLLSMVTGLFYDMWMEKKAAQPAEKKAVKEKKASPLLFHFLCFLLFMANGIISITTTASQKAADAVPSNDFLLLCRTEIAVISLVLLLILGIRSVVGGNARGLRDAFVEIAAEPPMTEKHFGKLVLFCALYAVCNGVANLFSLNCAQTMDASIQFPILSAVVIVMGALLGLLVFHEKIEKQDWVGLLLSAAGVVFFIL